MGKFIDLYSDISRHKDFVAAYESTRYTFTIMEKIVLRDALVKYFGISNTNLSLLFVPFNINLQVSCCGCFNPIRTPEYLSHILSYNIASYPDASVFVLTTLEPTRGCLTEYIAKFGGLDNISRMLNDVSFLQCEEPLIGEALWKSLDPIEKEWVAASLAPPDFRPHIDAPQLIKASRHNIVGPLGVQNNS